VKGPGTEVVVLALEFTVSKTDEITFGTHVKITLPKKSNADAIDCPIVCSPFMRTL
jgi:hypothetical protein